MFGRGDSLGWILVAAAAVGVGTVGVYLMQRQRAALVQNTANDDKQTPPRVMDSENHEYHEFFERMKGEDLTTFPNDVFESEDAEDLTGLPNNVLEPKGAEQAQDESPTEPPTETVQQSAHRMVALATHPSVENLAELGRVASGLRLGSLVENQPADGSLRQRNALS